MTRTPHAFCAVLIALCMWFSVTTAAQETIPAMVRRGKGMVEGQILREFSPVGLPELAKDCDLVARVVVVDGRTRLSDDEQSMNSEYTLQVIDNLFSRRTLLPGENIIVRKPGGTITIDGYRFTMSESDFPSFEVTDEYILFLRFDPSTGQHVVPYGAQGAFRIVAGGIEQVSSDTGTWNSERGRTSLLTFIQELTTILASR